MVSDEDMEKIGMDVTMQYERQQGWTPEDVSKENLGFDVRSTSPDGHKRYIEVKARAEMGAVALTQNEWFKAKRFQDEFYLYAVLNASKAPVLYRVENPAALLMPEEQVEVRYLVSVNEITVKGRTCMSNGKQVKRPEGSAQPTDIEPKPSGRFNDIDFRRFIEESFPVKEVGVASAQEKNIRHGHISTLHIWWARRPLAASRATAYAALTPAPKDAEEWQKKRDFIIQLSQWENSNNQSLLERARREILEANGGVPPKVLDPFSGGGSYPLEALRLGCESYANDYNPVAVLIEKATLEYPQKFGRPFEGMPEWAKPQAGNQKTEGKKKKKGKMNNPLFSTRQLIQNH